MPFANTLELQIHFVKHGAKFGLSDAAEYEAMADAFMTGAMDANTRECTRPNLVDYLRLNFRNLHFGVLCLQNDSVRTFYPVEARLVRRRSGAAAYFRFECGRTTL